MINFMKVLLNDLKIAQCCSYYSNYTPTIKQFEEEQLAPKIANSDQLTSPQVIKLLSSKQ